MARRARCCLDFSLRAVNALVIVCGVAMIIYSLWLLKKWNVAVSQLQTDLKLPNPWFIHGCLGVGISVCLSTLFGHIVVNSTTGSSLICLYILAISSLLLIEIASVVTVFFKIDWIEQFSKLIDDHHREFKSFVIFNISLCRLMVIIALVPQIYVTALAIILWGIGAEQSNNHFSYLEIPDFRNSFLVGPSSSVPAIPGQIGYGNLVIIDNISPTQNPLRSLLLYLIGVFRTRFPSRAR